MNKGRQDLEQEKNWYLSRDKRNSWLSRLLFHPAILNQKRLSLSYAYACEGVSATIVDRFHGIFADKLLVAPCGDGVDYQYVKLFAKKSTA